MCYAAIAAVFILQKHCQYHACWHHYLLHYGMVERHGFFCLLQGIGLFVRNDMEFRFCYTKTGVADGSLL